MVFNFGKYTEVTDFAFKVSPEYTKHGYIRFFICSDVWDFWFVRILANTNEEYEHEEEFYLMERNKIPMDFKCQKLTISKLRQIIREDDFSNWDFIGSEDLDGLIDDIDDGFGINNLKESPDSNDEALTSKAI